ncbi:glycerophosphodiester phosphodiesterase [Colwellia psychrerythraea]|uniref:Glycerophosphoryl diester phosphodiesterase n=1 Tax=Colwellia psychrerythraea TaxID=28229 RepID=A0A099KD60_COLPS|nr:glycerophosphodiester phosphodiesterase family protein [Colwellia psychrerythraea]KGJ87972.1 glycerophosphoryl diester phosphodiesterase [Colwellia psychrerythraea]
MLIFAHRGVSAIEPENTILAFRAACTANAYGIEFDIHHVDGQLIVIHDRYLDRTTSGSGLLIEHTFAQLRQLDAGKGTIIPTLGEVLTAVANQCVINIELKGMEIEDISILFKCLDNAKKVLKLNFKNILLSSFNHHLLQAIYRQRPEFSLGALTAALPLNHAKFAQQLNAYSVHIVVDYVCAEFVLDAHQRGLKVYVYTVDKLSDIKRMKVIGVDGIFANNPKQAQLHLNQLNLK